MFGSFGLLTLPGDDATWSVAIFVSTGDQPLKRLRHAERFGAVVAACPMHAQWLEGEPLGGVAAMSGIVDRCRRLVVAGQPVVCGVVPVADAWACTNLSLGRGITLGLLHAQRLRDVVRSHADDPLALVEALDAVTEADLMPWYRETVAEDRALLCESQALLAGRAPELPAAPEDELRAALLTALLHDPDIFRGFVASRAMVTPLSETLASPGMAARVREVAAGRERRSPLGPDREELLRLLA